MIFQPNTDCSIARHRGLSQLQTTVDALLFLYDFVDSEEDT